MKKNDYVEGEIVAYGCEGEGIMKADGKTVFVPFTAVGERVRVKILKIKNSVAYAKLDKIITPSPHRVKAECGAFTKCGGCQLLHLDYAEQLEYKKSLIENTLKKIAFLNFDRVPVCASQSKLRYRTKLQLPVRKGDNGAICGFFAPNSHRVVEVDDCLLHGEWAKSAADALKNYMAENCVEPYDESAGTGTVRHLIVKKIGEDFIVVLVVKNEKIANVAAFDKKLSAIFKKHSLFLNVNGRDDNVILGERFIKISGEGVATGVYEGIKYEVGPASFMQVNPDVMEKIYGKAASFIGENDFVIDAYCGAGVLSCAVAKKCKSVLGIEIVDEAVRLAKITARENGVENASFICSPCEDALPAVIAERKKKGIPTVLLLDPPRKGLDHAVCEAIISSAPDKIIYISCSPQTLARDIGVIAGTLKFSGNGIEKAVDKPVNAGNGEVLPSGYSVEYLGGFDMFSACKGVETLLVLKKEF